MMTNGEYKNRKYVWKEGIFMIGETRQKVYNFLIYYIRKKWISAVCKGDL